MILNNWWAYLAAIYTNPISTGGAQDLTTGMRNVNGELVKLKFYATVFMSDNIVQATKINPKLDLSIGLSTDNTEPSPNEYYLAGDITSWYNITQNFTTSYEEGKEITIAEFTAINTDTSVLSRTINSIAIFKNVVINTGGTAKVLIVRELLEEPIVVPMQGTFQRVFKWESM